MASHQDRQIEMWFAQDAAFEIWYTISVRKVINTIFSYILYL